MLKILDSLFPKRSGELGLLLVTCQLAKENIFNAKTNELIFLSVANISQIHITKHTLKKNKKVYLTLQQFVDYYFMHGNSYSNDAEACHDSLVIKKTINLIDGIINSIPQRYAVYAQDQVDDIKRKMLFAD
ncbi:hypothetical protein KO527_05285 [Pseudoalteromonas sp. C2R02]|uniref:hypothetical protein n=1 Tax=Pseudoalteromonas sp. C2R02 TaxID=2841565 RepID=UPI001C09F8F9|nr:hypothetical protein [Pseudoalteromonas sp. C2R02]MBU2968761.1 hypothetical protein [Pseudoalteromonas sp. C2R02]